MKNIIKKGTTLIMSLIMAFGVMSGVPVMAAEAQPSEDTSIEKTDAATEFEMEVQPGESVDLGSMLATTSTSSTIDQTFTMGSYHRGADRSYSDSHLRFAITITDTNGNPTSSTLSLGFQDYNGNSRGWLLNADGSTFSQNNISIVAGRVYYFTYYNNGSQTLRVNMVIISY